MIPFSYELAKAIQEDSLRRAMAGFQAAEAHTAKRRTNRKRIARAPHVKRG